MKDSKIYLGSQLAQFDKSNVVTGEVVVFENENYYKISNYDSMRPFFMSIVSNTNQWLFISSNGGLTAGRKNAQSALFPYYTDDKITEMAETTGSKTIVRVQTPERTSLWEPFSNRYTGVYNVQRNLYKNNLGNKIVFEETNQDLNLTFRYHWNTSGSWGFVRKSTLVNHNTDEVGISILDGIQNIMPFGINADLQNVYSNLVDAYKKNELQPEINLGIYSLSAVIVDRAEPSEALKATTVWSTGLENAKFLLCSLQLDAFRKGGEIHQEKDVRAEKGAYFACSDFSLPPDSDKNWLMVADVNQSRIDMSRIATFIKNTENVAAKIQETIEQGSKELTKLTSSADGLQLTADELRNTRHFANTLFNLMRGGIFDNNYILEKSDFLAYLQKANRLVFQEKKSLINQFPDEFKHAALRTLANQDNDADFKRLAYEYLPLKFSRRHGDPSRPWNKFSINTKAEDGSKILDYEGNWRDIFQNWEALAYSYPSFIEGMIHKFLNATTFDGYNPYRVTKGGFDWEVIEPNDPWSYIGYWGDHQIIYLLKFLEFIENYYPAKLAHYFNQDIFVYANVPYKIKSYAEILANPKDTIVFDEDLDHEIALEKQKVGADAALLKDVTGNIYKVNLIEKLLATVLAKVSNYIPEGGIWMNTQRPEWNDANNALVGNGVSMVTLYYLRRFLRFFEKTIANATPENLFVSEELATFFHSVSKALEEALPLLHDNLSDVARKTVMDALGNAGSDYRDLIYGRSFSKVKTIISKADLLNFISTTITHLDHSITANKRTDKLFHAYNLMTVKEEHEVSIAHLPEMLEGQVAVLSSGYLDAKASLELLDSLKNSALFRHDQYSYILYPNKNLPRFYEKNNIPAQRIEKVPLVQELLKNNDATIIEKDLDGQYHFNGGFNNAASLQHALSSLPTEKYGELVASDTATLLAVFEEVFNHKAFTGRSGTFFGYEGLGSIYWHMVSKLLVSVQETCLAAMNNQETKETVGKLLEHYYEINEGIGVHKSPELYGAFPTDPYSHTPGGKGAQQPGMTGQVKEDILSRFGELGVFVKEGKLFFNPALLRNEEFLKTTATFTYTTVNQEVKNISIDEDSLCFTCCQVPIIYKLAQNDGITLHFNDSTNQQIDGLSLDSDNSSKLFERTGEIERLVVSLSK